MNYYSISALVNFILSFTLGGIVLTKNPKSKINLTFFLFAITVAFWSLSYFFWQIATSEIKALFWARMLMAFAIFIPAFYLHFFFSLAGNYKKKILIATYAVFSIFFLIDLLTSQFVVGMKPVFSFRFWPIPGTVFHLFLLVWGAYVVYSTYLLYSLLQKSSGLTKMQTRYLLLGMVIGFAGGSTNYFLWYGIPILPVGNILVSVYVAMTAYTIIRHRFLDIRLVIARTIAYSLLIAIISVFYVAATFVLSSIFLGSAASGNQFLIYTILTIIVALSFERVRHIVEKLTDKIFFKGRYDFNELLSRLGSIMSTNIELKPLTTQILQTLIEQMRISKGAFLILGEGVASIYDIIEIGFPHKLSLIYSQISAFFPFSQVIVFDELEENHLKSLMRDMDISVVKILKVKDQIGGLLLLGEKASGEIYSDQDLKVLEILAPEMAVAIQNSQSYDKIKKFNVILSQEVREATSDLQNANNKLKQLDQLKDDFVSIASHELRTPMTAIRSYAWMALHRSDVPLSPTLEKYIARILISTERLINLVNDMLNVSRIESGRIEINPEPVDVLSLTRDIVDEVYYSKSEEKSIQFIVSDRQVPKAFADPDKLGQVFLNLVGNSLKFTPNGGKISFDFFSDGKTVEISVSDTGVGIPREDLSKLFHKFGRLDNSYAASATSGGTGLGLYISKNLVELMHGKIWAQSEGLNKGATFIVALPVATPDVLQDIDKYRVKPKGESKALEPVAI